MAISVQQTIDGSATGYTKWIDMRGSVHASLTIQTPAGPNGAYTIEATDDAITVADETYRSVAPASTLAPAVDITASSRVVTTGSLTVSGSAANALVTILAVPSFVRVKYTRTSGSGSINVFAYGCKDC